MGAMRLNDPENKLPIVYGSAPMLARSKLLTGSPILGFEMRSQTDSVRNRLLCLFV